MARLRPASWHTIRTHPSDLHVAVEHHLPRHTQQIVTPSHAHHDTPFCSKDVANAPCLRLGSICYGCARPFPAQGQQDIDSLYIGQRNRQSQLKNDIRKCHDNLRELTCAAAATHQRDTGRLQPTTSHRLGTHRTMAASVACHTKLRFAPVAYRAVLASIWTGLFCCCLYKAEIPQYPCGCCWHPTYMLVSC